MSPTSSPAARYLARLLDLSEPQVACIFADRGLAKLFSVYMPAPAANDPRMLSQVPPPAVIGTLLRAGHSLAAARLVNRSPRAAMPEFMIGVLRHCGRLLEEIPDEARDDFRTAILCAGRCALGSPGHFLDLFDRCPSWAKSDFAQLSLGDQPFPPQREPVDWRAAA